MKQFLPIILLSFTFLLLFSGIAFASSCPGYENALVPCGQAPSCPCQLTDFFVMVKRIYNFILLLATLLATLMIVIGGLLILLSGGPGGKNPVTGDIIPNAYSRGKDMIMWAAISLVLMWGAWLIIDVLLKTIGYTPTSPWNIF